VRRGPGRGLFDAWSLVYDLAPVQRLVYRPEQDAVLRALAEEPVRRVLDLGCGTGQLAHRLAAIRPAVGVCGCDLSPGMLRQARRRDAGVGWVGGDAGRLPFRSAAFDAVVSTEAFHWFPDQPAALREIARVLRPGGRLLLTVVVPPLGVVRQAAAVASRLVGQPLRWRGAAELRRVARAAGLRVERQRPVFRLPGAFLLPPVLTVARAIPAPRNRPA
jgi:ubiquinone/menaquinone biosynthesis C-methylase UbiE